MTKRLVLFLLAVHFFYGCTSPKDTYYSFRVGTYALDTVKNFVYFDNLISYGNYLFEFRNKITYSTIMHGNVDSTTISYDTIGVYLLSGKNKLYYEFDTFAFNNKVVKVGKLTEKEMGFKFTFPPPDSTSDLSYAPVKKVILKNINYFVSEVVRSDKTKNDSMQSQAILVKNKNFNSLYKMNGVKFIDSNYCIVGFYFYDLKKKEGLLQEIESMRPLTKMEFDICANMVQNAKAGN